MQVNKKKLKKVICINILLFLLLIGYYFLNHNWGVKIVCPFYTLTGLLCPGCGITRCLFSILQLEFKKAFLYNRLVFILLPFFLGYYLYNIYNYVLNKKRVEIPNWLVIILLIITLSFGVIRNII